MHYINSRGNQGFVIRFDLFSAKFMMTKTSDYIPSTAFSPAAAALTLKNVVDQDRTGNNAA